MVQRKLGLQADHPKPPPSSSSSHNLQEPNFKKKIKKSRSMKLSNTQTPKSSSSSSSSQKHDSDSNSKSSSKLPNYMKSTNSSDARKQQQQQQQQPQVSDQTQISKKRHGSGSCSKEPRTRTRTMTRSSSLRSVRALVKTHSFKHATRAPPSSKERSRAALRKEIDIERATCSSTLKNSRFPGFLELSHGGTEAQGTSTMRVCPYLYCSLNGHHHNNPSPPLKAFLKAKRRSLKTQRSIKKKTNHQDIEVYVKNKDDIVVEISLSEGSPESDVDHEEVIQGLNIGGFCFESDCEEDEHEANMEDGGAISESSGMEWCEVDELEVMSSDQIEDIHDGLKLGFSPETENLDFQELDCPGEEVQQEQEVIEDEGQCCFDDTELVAMLFTSPEIEVSLETENLEIQELDGLVQEVLQEQEDIENEDRSFDGTDSSTMLVISPEIEFINHLKDGFSPEPENGELELENMSKVDVLVQEVLQEQEVIEDEPEENGASEEVDAQVKDGHEVMYSDQIEDISDLKLGFSQETENLEIQELDDAMVEQVLQEQEVMEEDESQPSDDDDTESGTMLVATSAMEPKPEIEGNGVPEAHTQLEDGESDDAHVQKKVVSEVIDEVARSNPHADIIVVQKVVSEVTDEVIGSNPHYEAHTQLKDGESDAPVQKVVSEVTDKANIADQRQQLKGGFVPKPSKHQETTLEDDSDTKWRIGSRRVLEEVEEDTSFNPKEPNYLPIAPDQESEKVDLKHQMMDERRSDNEWMIDYVLQQTVTKLAPARKRKVALLVEAFESVLPIPRYNEPPTRSVFAHSRPIQACN